MTSHALLPPPMLFNVRHTPGRLTKRLLGGMDHLLLITPHPLPPSVWREVPGLAGLRALQARLGKKARGRPLRGTLETGPGSTGTGVTLGALAAPTLQAALLSPYALLKFAGELAADALSNAPRSLGLLVQGFNPSETERLITALLLALGAQAWTGPSFARHAPPPTLKTVHLLGQEARLNTARTEAEIEGANLVRWLAMLPANKLSAPAYREVLAELATRHGWSLEWFGEAALKGLNAGAFLAVSQGNGTAEAGIACLRYRPPVRPDSNSPGTNSPGPAPDLALVGKGIIFDTGGTNIKSAAHMLDMHTDMTGSAVALAVLQALTRLHSPLSVDCWLAISENRTGPAAYKQRDVVTASNGVTIEIVHTDAEGRLVLADTLALACREKPTLVMDYATLAGSCVEALSERYSGVFTNREALHQLLVQAGRECGERVWPFPNDPDFDEDLMSRVADVAQCAPSGAADHILAARFLQRFVPPSTPWIHLDLAAALRKAGLAHVPGGATGFGVRYSLALLLEHGPELKALAACA